MTSGESPCLKKLEPTSKSEVLLQTFLESFSQNLCMLDFSGLTEQHESSALLGFYQVFREKSFGSSGEFVGDLDVFWRKRQV